MIYRESKPTTREAVKTTISRAAAKEICAALFDAVNTIDDFEWNQQLCLEMLDHSDAEVRAAAIICLGELARLHGRIDLELVLPALSRTYARENLMRGPITDAVDNFNIFARAKVTLPNFTNGN